MVAGCNLYAPVAKFDPRLANTVAMHQIFLGTEKRLLGIKVGQVKAWFSFLFVLIQAKRSTL